MPQQEDASLKVVGSSPSDGEGLFPGEISVKLNIVELNIK